MLCCVAIHQYLLLLEIGFKLYINKYDYCLTLFYGYPAVTTDRSQMVSWVSQPLVGHNFVNKFRGITIAVLNMYTVE